MPLHRLSISLLTGASLLLIVGLPFLPDPFQTEHYYGRSIAGPAPDFLLHDVQQRPVRLSDYRGKFVYLMFGYLGCEDICHNQALTFYNLNRQIPSERVQFLYIGMDPKHDTADRIAVYFDARGANFTGLLADDQQHAQQVASGYRAYFSYQPIRSDGIPRINHPGYIYLIDPQGELKLVYSGGSLSLERMIDDLNMMAVHLT
ncbi:MAG: SCO family protein [Candidatus Thiodiazotropha sp.]